MKKATQIVIFMLLFLTFSTFAQEQVEVKGVVTSDSEPLPGVSIRIKGRAIGTETDFNGNYSIRVPKGATLVFSYLGMKPKEIKVGNTLTINVDLKEDSSALDEVIIVAYGTAKKTAFTGSATQINAAECSIYQNEAPNVRIPNLLLYIISTSLDSNSPSSKERLYSCFVKLCI